MVQQQQTVHHAAALHINIYSYPQAAAAAASKLDPFFFRSW
jgi:hypothetical protein